MPWRWYLGLIGGGSVEGALAGGHVTRAVAVVLSRLPGLSVRRTVVGLVGGVRSIGAGGLSVGCYIGSVGGGIAEMIIGGIIGIGRVSILREARRGPVIRGSSSIRAVPVASVRVIGIIHIGVGIGLITRLVGGSSGVWLVLRSRRLAGMWRDA